MGYPKIDDEYSGRYRIVRRIGHGGMGVVYEALDKVLNRRVALKIVLPSLPDREDFHARFAREASVLARIRSRNIVGIHEYGEHDDTVYFVTELFPDGDLRTWLEQHGPLDRRAALALVAQVCEALADAHAAGIIHRDVKPGNVLLWSRPEGLIPYLCDFGIALDGNSEHQRGLTRAGTLVGSPAYMAPERHFGHPADERGDVYSTGCLLWAALTGDAPYAGTDFQMINSHINSPIPQLATGDPIDDRIDVVLAAALHKDPEQRIPTVTALREALLEIVRDIDVTVSPVLAGATIEPPPPPPPRPAPLGSSRPGGAPPDRTVIRPVARPGGRRGRGLVAAVAAALVAGVALAGYLVHAARDDGPSLAGPDQNPSAPVSGATAASGAPSIQSLAVPAAPRARARPGYRSVSFLVAEPRPADGVEQQIEVRTGTGWAPAERRLRVPTRQGGDRACVRLRTVARDTQGQQATSDVSRTCDRAAPRTVRLVRTPGSCSDTINAYTYPCQWYGVVATGFADNATPLARLRPVDQDRYCADFDCQRVPIGDNGRGRLTHYFRIFTDSGVYVLDLDGVTTRARLYYR
jgi:tRNA A-37 threonylcarbamoyl transferase component Bud32